MNYVFFGNNVPLAERLRKALGTGVIADVSRIICISLKLFEVEKMAPVFAYFRCIGRNS